MRGDVLYGKLRPYLHNWLFPQFEGIALGDFWVLRPKAVDPSYLYRLVQSSAFDGLANISAGSKMPRADWHLVGDANFGLPPNSVEQRKIGALFSCLDDLIALHQRKLDAYRGVSPSSERRKRMAAHTLPTDLFCNYYRDWIVTYKEGAIRKVTMDKYLLTAAWIDRLVPDLPIKDLTRAAYQQLLNGYAEHHERQTTMDFHHQLKCAILDAVDEGLLERDPTRKAVIKGKPPRAKKPKYLNQFELHKLLDVLHLDHHVNWDWLILLIAKTGLRFSEALAVTPDDFNFSRQVLSVDKGSVAKSGVGASARNL